MKRIITIAILFFVNSPHAAVQLELKGYDILGETKPGNGIFGSNGAALAGYLYGSYAIAPHLQLFLTEELDNAFRLAYTEPGAVPMEKMSPFYEKEIPSSNNIEAGLRYSGLGVLSLRVKNMSYFGAQPIYPDFLQTQFVLPDTSQYYHGQGSDAIKRYYRNNVNASWQIPFGGFSLCADVNYFGLHYTLDQMGVNMANSPMTDTVFSSFDDTYSDLWSHIDLGYAFSKSLGMKADVMGKNNLNGGSDYTLYRYMIQLEGAQGFPSDNRLAWGVAGRWYENEIMREHGFAIGPGGIFYARDVYSLDNGLFLKGMVTMEVGHNLYKQRFEVSVRKAWDNESFVEPGYFTNQGGLFPTQGFYAKSKAYVVKAFSVALNIESVWEGPDNKKYNGLTTMDMASYIKTAGNLELAYAIAKHCELLTGLDYTYYNSEVLQKQEFPSRGGVYLGTRMWLR